MIRCGGINLIECLSGKEPLRLDGPGYTPEEASSIRERVAGLKEILRSRAGKARAEAAEKSMREREDLAARKKAAADAVSERSAK